MFLLITGGSCSGKSAYAEDRIAELCGLSPDSSKIYLATMQVYDAESEKRVERHRAMRAGKGFRTVECPCDLPDCFENIRALSKPVILLECMSNLIANEMFRKTGMVEESILVPKVLREAGKLRELAEHLVIVTNNIFEDGVIYDEWTRRYIKALGEINTGLAGAADEVWEIVCGIPVRCG